MQYLPKILIDTSSSASPSMENMMQLPPGFRFHPSDEELIVHYLNNKLSSNLLPASIITDIDLYKCNPWELPNKALLGEDEWYFFTPRDRKYPNGARPNRAAASGYWKATGTDKPILNSSGTMSIGVKKALVFYKGRPPRGVKTEWIMHEYRVIESMNWNLKRKGCMRLDDWVLCRVRQKSSTKRSDRWEDQNCSGCRPTTGSYLSKGNKLLRADANPDMEMIRNYLYNDCPMLPYLFTSQDFRCTETTSTISFQGSDTSCSPTSVQKNCFDDQDSLFSVASFEKFLDFPAKRKLAERDLQEYPVQPTKKVAEVELVYMKDDVTSTSNNGTVMNFRGGDHSDSSHFCFPWNSNMQYQELDHLAFR